jgi:hypothetical protein
MGGTKVEIAATIILYGILPALIFGVIFRKAGYSGWLGLLMAVPGVNLAMLAWFATTTWPLEMGYGGQAGNARVDQAWEMKMSLRKAMTLEKRGHLQEAIAQFEHVIAKAGNHPNADLARERIRLLQEKINRSGGGKESVIPRP